MNKTTYEKISEAAAKLHSDRKAYEFLIPLLDEPYQLALKIMEFEDESDHKAAKELALNW